MILSRVPLISTFIPIFGTTKRVLSPADTANKLVQNLEEQYGTEHIDFFTDGGYMEALTRIKRNYGVALLFFTSSKNDDSETFSRSVLMNQELKEFLNRRNILCWTGDVCEDEAFRGSRQFHCTKFPSAVLVMYSPQLSELVVAAQLHGCLDSSSIITNLTNALAKHLPSLERFRSEREAREAARELRRQQDNAYQASLARDRERQAFARAEEERLAKEKEEREIVQKKKKQYRAWLASNLPPEPSSEDEPARLSIRFPDGSRAVRRFKKDDTVESVYNYVDYMLFEKEEPEEFGRATSSSNPVTPPSDYKHDFHFQLYSSLPRALLKPSVAISTNKAIFPNGTVVVELDD